MRFISADRLIEELKGAKYKEVYNFENFIDLINEQPTIPMTAFEEEFKWISFDEKLPSDGQEVLLHVHMEDYNGGGKYDWYNSTELATFHVDTLNGGYFEGRHVFDINTNRDALIAWMPWDAKKALRFEIEREIEEEE